MGEIHSILRERINLLISECTGNLHTVSCAGSEVTSPAALLTRQL